MQAPCNLHGRQHADQEEYDLRLQTYAAHKALIEEHNAANLTWKLAINKFADWTQVRRPAIRQTSMG